MAEAAEIKKEPEVQKVNITVGNKVIVHEIFSRSQRGSKGEIQEPICVPVLDVNDAGVVHAYMQLVGVPNFISTLNREILRPAAFEASEVGFTEQGFNHIKYLENYKGYFDIRQAKSRGPKKADILQSQAAFAEELTTLMVKHMAGQLLESDKNRFLQIKTELAKLAVLLAKKERKGKAPTSEPAPAK